MAVETLIQLKKILFDTYGGFGDKRLKDLGCDAGFIVDDRTTADHDARGKHFLWFCEIWAQVESAQQVRLTFRGGLPTGKAVADWLKSHNAETTGYGVEIAITPLNVVDLDRLAMAFRSITQARYKVAAYKYVVPRTADSISRLRQTLGKAWADA